MSTPSPTPPPPVRRRIPCPPWAEAFRSIAIAWQRCVEPMQLVEMIQHAAPTLENGVRVGRALRAATRTTLLSSGLGMADVALAAITPLVDEVLDAPAPTVELATARLAEVEARVRRFVDEPPHEVDAWLAKGAKEDRSGVVKWNPVARAAFTTWIFALRALAASLTAVVRGPSMALVEWLDCAGPGAWRNASLHRLLADRIREQIPTPPEGFAEPTPPPTWNESNGGAA